MHHYRAYELLISSDLELPDLGAELEGYGAACDLTVRLGPVPEAMEDPHGAGVFFQARPGELLYTIEGVGRYYVCEGRDIVVQPDPEAVASDVRVFLLGSCLGAVLHQRGKLVLHASGMRTAAGEAALFAGPSGVGKSTLLAALVQRGHSMMVDDVCAVDVAPDGMATVPPAFPRTRIWKDAAKVLGECVAGLPRTRPHLPKFDRHVEDGFCRERLPLGHLYILAPGSDPEIRFEPLSPLASARALWVQTYRRQFVDGLGLRSDHFAQAARLAGRLPVTRIHRPQHPFLLDELVDAVESHLDTGLPARHV